jgi:hypothetical protein
VEVTVGIEIDPAKVQKADALVVHTFNHVRRVL